MTKTLVAAREGGAFSVEKERLVRDARNLTGSRRSTSLCRMDVPSPFLGWTWRTVPESRQLMWRCLTQLLPAGRKPSGMFKRTRSFPWTTTGLAVFLNLNFTLLIIMQDHPTVSTISGSRQWHPRFPRTEQVAREEAPRCPESSVPELVYSKFGIRLVRPFFSRSERQVRLKHAVQARGCLWSYGNGYQNFAGLAIGEYFFISVADEKCLLCHKICSLNDPVH